MRLDDWLRRAQAGTQRLKVLKTLDSRLRGNDELRCWRIYEMRSRETQSWLMRNNTHPSMQSTQVNR